jgi:hypothetical protein
LGEGRWKGRFICHNASAYQFALQNLAQYFSLFNKSKKKYFVNDTTHSKERNFMPRRKQNGGPPKRRGRPPKNKTAPAQRAAREAAVGDNRMNVDAFNAYAETIKQQDAVLRTYAGEHRSRCKGPRGVMRAARERAANAGVPMEAAALKIKLLRRQWANERDRSKAEPDTLSLVLELERARGELGALADTPLGAAHMDTIKRQGETQSAMDDFAAHDDRPRYMREQEAERERASQQESGPSA